MKQTKDILMRKIFLYIMLCFTFSSSIFCFSACREQDTSLLTNTEVIAETKIYLTDCFESGNIYTNINLPTKYEVNENQSSYITWQSSDDHIINATTGKINRTLTTQFCTLFATITYKDSVDMIKFFLTIPANCYTNSSPLFKSNGAELQFKVAYFAYNENGTVSIDIYVYNNLSSKKTLYNITDMTFSIYQATQFSYQYFSRGLHYTSSSNKNFTCKYGNYVKISLPTISKSEINACPIYSTNIEMSIIGNVKYTHAS